MSLRVLRMSRITIHLHDPETKYSLEYPAFFITAGKATLRKLLCWCCMYDHLNRDTIDTLNRELPYLEETVAKQDADDFERLRKEWEYQKELFERDRKSLNPSDFPYALPKAEEKREIKERRDFNKRIYRYMRAAEDEYLRAQKKAPKNVERAREVLEIFRAAVEEYGVSV